jgi:hypothetical protein
MATHSAPNLGIVRNNLVAAVFLDDTSARDAIADLKIAGFHTNEIGVCTSHESSQAHLSADPAGKHSLWWRLRHSAQIDLEAHGTSLTNKGYLAVATQEQPAFTELQLDPTMRSLGIGANTIQLVNREIGPAGLLLYVAAGDRVTEVETILEKNRGYIRSAMAVETPPDARDTEAGPVE